MGTKTSDTAEEFNAAPVPPPPAKAEAALTSDALSAAPGASWVVIEPEDAGVRFDLGELWAYRELFYFLTLRDLKVRYKQTLMGVAWVVIQPLFMMLITTLVLSRFVRLDAGELPYPLSAYAGLMLWTFFANAVTNSTGSLINNSNLVTKVYFPRMFIPAAAVAAGLVDLAITALVLLGLAAFYGVAPSPGAALIPFFVMLITLLGLSVGLLVSALTVKYRDLRHALPFVLQFWMFASPVIYPLGVINDRWKWVFVLNPLTGIIEGFRSSLTGASPDWPAVAVSAVVTALLLVASVYVFRRVEDTFADLI